MERNKGCKLKTKIFCSVGPKLWISPKSQSKCSFFGSLDVPSQTRMVFSKLQLILQHTVTVKLFLNKLVRSFKQHLRGKYVIPYSVFFNYQNYCKLLEGNPDLTLLLGLLSKFVFNNF